jgi:hypothetical protein
MNVEHLFRKEVVVAASDSLYGRVVLTRPIQFTYFILFSGVCAALLIIFLFCGTYSKRTMAPGILLPKVEPTNVYAGLSGSLAGPMVEEGQIVAEGDLLYISCVGKSQQGCSYGPSTPERLNNSPSAVRPNNEDIFAAREGVVAAIYFRGGLVEKDQLLLSIIPRNSQIKAEIYVPAIVAARVTVGLQIKINMTSTDRQYSEQHAATVIGVSRVPVPVLPSQLSKDTSYAPNSISSVYRVTAVLDGLNTNVPNFALGSPINAELFVDRQHLTSWFANLSSVQRTGY